LKFVYSPEYSIEKGLTSLLTGLKEFEDDDDILLLFGDCLPSHDLLKNIINCPSEICFHHAEASPELHIAKFKKRALGNLMELEDEISKIRLAGSYNKLPLTCGFSAYLGRLGAKRIIDGSYREFDYFRNASGEEI